MASRSGDRSSISLITATSLVVANMVGTGIFTSLGFQVGELRSGFAIVVLWALGGVCALCGALAYGELAGAMPRSGGEYHYLSRIYHPAAGFLAGWISATVGFAAPVALAAMAFGRYFSHVVPSAPPLAMSLAVVALVTIVHLRGIAFGSAFQNTATVLKVLLILALIAAGAMIERPQPISFTPHVGDGGLIASAPFAVSLVYVMYAYSGWNASTYIVGEIRNPARNVPLSLAIGTLIVTALYVALNAVFLHAAPVDELAGKIEIGQIAATHIFGNAGGRIMAGLICLGLISSISAMIWVGPRVAMTMGEDCRALAFLGRKSDDGVPRTAILLQSAIVITLILTASFDAVLTYIQFSLTFCSFLTVLGVLVLRFARPDLPRPFRAWGYPVTPLLFLAVNAWMLWHIGRERPLESVAGFGTMLLGLLVYVCVQPAKNVRTFS
jgi:APA family basic amino acid/polyamine antiporter